MVTKYRAVKNNVYLAQDVRHDGGWLDDREFVDAKDFDEVLKALESITRKNRLAALPFMHDEIKAAYDAIEKVGGNNDLEERETKFYGDVPL